MRWDIMATRGHYGVFAGGRVLFSADTKAEAMEELETWEDALIA